MVHVLDKIKQKVPQAVRTAAANVYAARLLQKATGITFDCESLRRNENIFIPGTRKLISLLAYPPYNKSLVMVSLASPDRFKAGLKRLGLDRIFGNRIVDASQVSKAKPDPDVYLRSLELHYKPKFGKASYVAIENTPDGVKAAKAAGMQCIALTTRTGFQKLKEAGADVVVNDLKVLVKILKRTALF